MVSKIFRNIRTCTSNNKSFLTVFVSVIWICLLNVIISCEAIVARNLRVVCLINFLWKLQQHVCNLKKKNTVHPKMRISIANRRNLDFLYFWERGAMLSPAQVFFPFLLNQWIYICFEFYYIACLPNIFLKTRSCFHRERVPASETL